MESACKKKKKKQKEGKVCEICGSVGFSENLGHLVTCSRCNKASQHIYCMPVLSFQMPEVWYCEECLGNRTVVRERRLQDICKEKKSMVQSPFHRPFKAAKNTKVKYISPEEINLSARSKIRGECSHLGALWRQNNYANLMPPPKSRTIIRSRPTSRPSSKAITVSGPKLQCVNAESSPKKSSLPRETALIDKEGSTHRNKVSVLMPYVRQSKTGVQGMGLPLTLLTNPTKKISNCPASEACWKGTFEVFDVVNDTYGGIEAFFHEHVSAKASEFTKRLPNNLELNILPRKYVWPKIFRLDAPNDEDIGLYFFPNEFERSKEAYLCLLERIDSCDFAMQALIGDVELVIYSSNQLTMDCQRKDEITYLWGIFRHMRWNKHCQSSLEKSLCSPVGLKKNDGSQAIVAVETKVEQTDMEIDMIGSEEVGRIDIPLPSLDAPPGFSKRLYSYPSHEEKSPTRISLNIRIPDNDDVPHGFLRTPDLKDRISSLGAKTEAQDCPVKQDNATDLLPKPYQVCESWSTLVEHSRSSHAGVGIGKKSFHSPEKHSSRIQVSSSSQVAFPELSLSRPQYVKSRNDLNSGI